MEDCIHGDMCNGFCPPCKKELCQGRCTKELRICTEEWAREKKLQQLSRSDLPPPSQSYNNKCGEDCYEMIRVTKCEHGHICNNEICPECVCVKCSSSDCVETKQKNDLMQLELEKF